MVSRNSSPEILAVTDALPPLKGGATAYTYHAILGIPSAVLVLCPFGSERPGAFVRIMRVFYTNFQIKNRFLRKGYSICLYLQMALIPLFWAYRFRKSLKVVMCFQVAPAGLAGYLIHRILGVPYAVVTYGEELTISLRKRLFGLRCHKWLMSLIISNAARVVTISEFTRSKLVHFRCKEGRVALIYPGIHVPRSVQPSKRILQMLNGRALSNTRIVLMAGRLIERKGFDNAIRAFTELKKEYADLCLVIAGTGEREESLKKCARQEGDTGQVIFVGAVSDNELHFLYSICKLFLLPTRTLEDGDTEGFGIVFIEAGAHGKAVIAGRTGATPEAVVDGVTGVLVDGKSTTEIRNALRAVLDDPDFAQRLGQEGRKRVERDFSVERQQREFRRMVEGLSEQVDG